MNPPTYRIKNWNDLYENNRTRDMKFMAWVPLPNRHDGDGYTDLVERKNGAALFGAWVAILQVASRCAPRGTLLRNSDATSAPSCADIRTLLRAGATPHDSASLSRMTRLPKVIIDEMLDVCTNDCKWLEIIESHDSAEIPHLPAEIPHPTDEERNGTERNRIEEKEEKRAEVKAPPEPRVPPPAPTPKSLTPDSLSFLRETLNREYRRPDTARWSCAEEGLLAEVSRRDRCKLELVEIVEYRGRLEAGDLKFFPQSVGKLLEKWDQMLDQARNYVGPRGKKSIHQQDAERLLRQVEKI